MNMNKKELEAFAKEAAKGIKTPEDLNELAQMLYESGQEKVTFSYLLESGILERVCPDLLRLEA